MSHPVTLIVAGDPAQLTGGYVYDARVVSALREHGWPVEVIGLEGRFPEPDMTARQALENALAAQPAGAHVILDGLAMGGLPDVLEAHAQRLTLTALVHHPLADETGLGDAERQRFTISETRALSAVRDVIVTSPFTARRLADFQVTAERLQVVEPGVMRASPARGNAEVPRLLCVATVTPRKGHDVLVEALATLTDLPWTCDCIGGLERAPAHVSHVQSRIAAHGLEARIHLLGERPADALDEAYHDSDIFVLPSHYEGYGMVVSEALAHALPVVTTNGGALAHTLPDDAGLKVPPGDAAALAAALREMLDDSHERRRWRDGAERARASLRDWSQVGAAFAAALQRGAA
ncbi:glycosyl transferase family 1 [Chromohalobacter marismortui]|uniref:Glycosyl transferase family 1 n=1 Tax=Chromohalobacter marismortui TaxID=42055 RepID=A0A4R7NUR9_9GAMM|nr:MULTISPECIES: glycosyltransferase family 4 protein [Chromohalobacter]MCI0510725.1 glycosyltransferase family 4 protein [Chromohalobacter sp.]MCI0593953.1 glycosyltransferase family 4 protein [Chromohalobacter sp.]TDU24698.1 glycosyl transferase family 1 [Chromohalobacter marismortui]